MRGTPAISIHGRLLWPVDPSTGPEIHPWMEIADLATVTVVRAGQDRADASSLVEAVVLTARLARGRKG